MAEEINPKKLSPETWRNIKLLTNILKDHPETLDNFEARRKVSQEKGIPLDLWTKYLPLVSLYYEKIEEEPRSTEETTEEKPHHPTFWGPIKEEPKSGMAGGTGTGTAATEKIERLKKAAPIVRGALTTEEQKTKFSEDIRRDFQQFPPQQPRPTIQPAPQVPPKSQPVAPIPQGPTMSGPRLQTMRRFIPSLRPQRQGGPISQGLDLFRPEGGMGGAGSRIGGSISNAVNAARTAANMMMNLGRMAGMLGTPAGLPLLVIFVVVGIFIIVFLFIMSQGGIGFGGVPSTSQIAGPRQINSSCAFTRSGVSAVYRSNLLLDYFQEASAISGVPASILAAIARVETPSAVNYTDNDIGSPPCSQSSTGALGLMQLQPPGTTGYYADGIELGASYLGTTASQLTRSDFCDIRKNIIIASGFVIKKTNAMLGTTGNTWNPAWEQDKQAIDKLAQGYYGCLNYGGPKVCTGPYSYGDDVWNGLKNCQTAITASGGGGLPGVGRTGIVQAAANIVSKLEKEWVCDPNNKCLFIFRKKVDEPNTVPYWCTYLISDSYNRIGLTDLTRLAHGAVVDLMAYFNDTVANGGKYRLLSQDVLANQLQPGDVVFLIGSGRHVTLIKDVRIDPVSGDGEIYTYESNGAVIEDVISVKNNRVLNAKNTSYPIVGFGQPVRL